MVSGLALSLLTGCVGTGPNTQQGAVTGGALGAIAGAVIGHNSRGGDALGGAILGGTVGAIAGGTIGNSVDQQKGTLYAPPPVERRVYRERATYGPPPPPSTPPMPDTVTPSPAPNALWVPGYWGYSEQGYYWVAGHWEIPPPNVQAYVVGHWEQQPRGYVFIPSYWR